MNPIAFSIGNIEIYWYSIFILIAFSLGFFIAYRESFRLKSIDSNKLFDYFFYLIPIVIIGARIYYVAFEWNIYRLNPIEAFKIWNGGLAIHGGIIAGIIYTIIYTRINKINIFRFMDMVVPSLALGQAIGRWGNFFNSEAYGPITTLEKLKSLHIPNFIIEGMNINGFYREPTFLYESLTCLIIFIILFLLRKYYKKLKVGILVGLYFIIYGVERFFVEGLRTDSLMLGNFKVAQIVSFIMVIVGITFITISLYKRVLYLEPTDIKKEKSKNLKEKKSKNKKEGKHE